MSNIFLTYKCNLHCPYCFANELKTERNINEYINISYENFIEAYKFIRKSKNEKISLIGGEPTLHPDFEKILKFLVADRINTKKLYIGIYTNGVELNPYVDLIKKGNFKILVNCNSPKDMREKNFEKLDENIKLLNKKIRDNFTLGINLYSRDMNYDFIFYLLKKYNQKYIRISLVIPNTSRKIERKPGEYFKENKDFIIGFAKKCKENNINPFFDCNNFRQCLFNNEELKLLNSFDVKFNLLENPYCIPVLDILPDLTAVRCLGLSDYIRVPISDFDNPIQLKHFFHSEIDSYIALLPPEPGCNDCKELKHHTCLGSCLAFKINDIIKLKEHCKTFRTDK